MSLLLFIRSNWGHRYLSGTVFRPVGSAPARKAKPGNEYVREAAALLRKPKRAIAAVRKTKARIAELQQAPKTTAADNAYLAEAISALRAIEAVIADVGETIADIKEQEQRAKEAAVFLQRLSDVIAQMRRDLLIELEDEALITWILMHD